MPIEVITSGVNLDEEEGRHEYTLDGVPLPGCTGILQRCGMYDLDGVRKDVLDAASRFGTEVHDYALWLDQKDLDVADLDAWPEHRNCVLGWRQFCEDFHFEAFLMEQPIAIRVNGMVFGVKPDRFGYGNFGPKGEKKVAAVELKTTAAIEPHHHVQTAGQALALKEEDPLPARFVVQLLKQPQKSGKFYRPQQCSDRMDESVFLWALGLDCWKRNNRIIH